MATYLKSGKALNRFQTFVENAARNDYYVIVFLNPEDTKLVGEIVTE